MAAEPSARESVVSDEHQGSYLKIKSETFNIELEGDPDFILSSYDTIRSSVLRRLIELIQSGEVQGAAPAKPRPQQSVRRQHTPGSGNHPAVRLQRHPQAAVSRAAAPVSTGTTGAMQKKVGEESYIWVYVTHDIYNKVYVIDTEAFSASSINRYLDGRRMRKIYIDQAHVEFLRPLLGTGKTLWSELTKKGRDQIAGTGPGEQDP